MIIELILYSLFGFICASFVHELGHLLMSLIFKWEFNLLIVGPFRWERDDVFKKVKFGFERNILYWGGLSAAIPRDKNHANLIVWKLVLLSGPLLSLLFSIIIFPLYLITDSSLLLLLSAPSFGIGLICILPLPIRSGLVYSDGYRFLRLILNGAGKLEEEAIFKLWIQEIIYDTIDLSIMQETVAPLLTSKDTCYRYYANYKLYKIAQKENNTAEVIKYRNYINDLSDKVPKSIRNQFDIS